MRPMSRPTIAKMMFGRRLREIRQQNGLSQAQAAKKMGKGFSDSKISDIERGMRTPSLFDTAGMCRVYGVAKDLEDELIRMSDKADEPGWWETYVTVMLKDFSMLLELEAHCGAIRQYEGELIPGLLQTEAYARAVQAADPLLNNEEADSSVQLRTERQRRFWSRKPFPEVVFIIHETAVTRPVCGAAGDEEQRARLLEASKSAKVLVVPHSVGAHPSMKGSYLIVDSSLEEIADVVYLESGGGSRYEEDDRTLTSYRTFFEATRKISVPIGDYLR